MTNPLLSIVIPTMPDRQHKLRRLLQSLARNTADRQRWEVLVVVDGSDQRPLEELRELPEKVARQGLTLQERRGPAYARNQAILQARGEWLLFLNDDAELAPASLVEHLRLIERDPSARLAYLGRFDWAAELLESPWRKLLARTSLVFHYDRLQAGELYPYNCFWTCNLSVRRDWVMQVGGFNELLTEAIHEDLELGYRLQRKFGLRVQAALHIPATHHHPLTVRDFYQREYRSGRVVRQIRTLLPDYFAATFGQYTYLPPDFSTTQLLQEHCGTPLLAQLRLALQELYHWEQPHPDDPSAHALVAMFWLQFPLKQLCWAAGYGDGDFEAFWQQLQP
ncbi:MAG: hypothetical protein HJJLKODD_02961 [Phycisphaerae bacterium]|nr:hypothetical protein [Phycisphaerae bacterium]